MIYITGDTHADFSRFTKRQRCRLPFELTEKDIVIVCGDFGLLWERNDRTLKYNLDWMSRLPFKILWVSGNHENYDMLETTIWKNGTEGGFVISFAIRSFIWNGGRCLK